MDLKVGDAEMSANQPSSVYSMKRSNIMISHVFGDTVLKLSKIRCTMRVSPQLGGLTLNTISTLAGLLMSYHTLTDLKLVLKNSTSSQLTYCVPQPNWECLSDGEGIGKTLRIWHTTN